MASDNTKRGRSRPKKIVSPANPSPTEVDILKTKLQQFQDESGNLELHVKRLINEKASLNDKIEQLTDDLNKYQELYARAKGVAQALGKAVSILTTEIKNG
jgi:chromosome segregation ATPase